MNKHIPFLLVGVSLVFLYVISEAKIAKNQNRVSSSTKANASSGNAAIQNQITATTTRKPILSGLRFPCSCLEGECGCCTGYILDRFNQKACLNLTYDPDDFAITAAMSMNGKIMYKNTVSGKNPPPMCISIPRVQALRFCVEFSNVFFASRNVHVCIDAEANWQDFTLVSWSFDCIRMGASGVAVIGPEEGGGLPTVAGVGQTDEDYDDSARNVVRPKNNRLIFDKSITKLGNTTLDSGFVRLRRTKTGYLVSHAEI